MKTQEWFLLEKYISDFGKKKKSEMTKEIIAGMCYVNTKTVENWADKTMGGMPGLRKSKILADHIGCSLNDFLLKYTCYKVETK